MANLLKARETDQFNIFIPGYKTDNYFVEFEIIVECSSNIKWKTYKRYSEFKKLFDELVKVDNKFKVYFPPKKSFNSMSSIFLNNRRKCLEAYLIEIASHCSNCLPQKLANFLEMDKYEIHGITSAMAKIFFEYGSTLLKNNNLFEITVMSINAINQRIASSLPSNLYNKVDEDFSNVIETVNSLKKVLIIPNTVVLGNSTNGYGDSTINISSLSFDISIFASVTDLHINSVEITNLRGLYKMNTTIERLRVHHCLKSIEDLLFADFPYTESNVGHLQKFDGPLRCAFDVDLSHNSITDIGISIVTLRQVQVLNLSYNQISDMHYMHTLTFLTELDLSYNHLHMSQCQSLSTKLGSITKLSLKGNQLTSLNIVDRMFSLEYLNVSENQLVDNHSLLSLCRLLCLDSLVINDNPICSHKDFDLMVFDMFLDRYEDVQVNGNCYCDIPSNIRKDIDEYRSSVKASILTGWSPLSVSLDSSSDLHSNNSKVNALSSFVVHFDDSNSSDVTADSILLIPEVYNIFIYWFFVAFGDVVYPKRLLWATEIFAPNRNIKPVQVLLATNTDPSPNMLKCRVSKSLDLQTKNLILTIEPKDFFVLSKDSQRIIIGADKSFLRADISAQDRDLYLCNDAAVLETFVRQLYHIEECMTSYGDSRILCLNEEDRMEMMRRFVDLWRLDMVINLKKNCDKVNIHSDADSEFLFISRAMLKMKNGFQILLTVVVTREIIFLVDERIYDWPDFNKHPNLSDLSAGNNCSPYSSSGGQFPFLRTNAYFLCQIEVCIEMSTTIDQTTIIDSLCPIFRYPVKITFNCSHQSMQDPLTLLFTNEQKTNHLCRIVQQQCDPDSTLCPSISITSPEDVQLTIAEPGQCAETPCLLRHLNSSYSEIRLCLALSSPKLSSLGRSPPDQVLSFFQSVFPGNTDDKLYGLIWTKFIYINFDTGDSDTETKESPGLVCLSSAGISVLFEEELDIADLDREYLSDPEDDRPNVDSRQSKLETLTIAMENIFRVYVGLNYQWLSVCCRSRETESEMERLVLVVRNKGLCKHIVEWMNALYDDRSKGESDRPSPMSRAYDHQVSDINELMYQIKVTSVCEHVDLVHYCSLEDVKLDAALPLRLKNKVCNPLCSNAAVLTTRNIAIVQHNISEYPIREYVPGSIRGSPSQPQYQVVIVVPLIDCLQLQLPGHDRSVLIIVIRSRDPKLSNNTTTMKLHLSISCQKEQKRLIDKLRQQRSRALDTDTPIPVNVC